jgi:hypothetical protein
VFYILKNSLSHGKFILKKKHAFSKACLRPTLFGEHLPKAFLCVSWRFMLLFCIIGAL